jgi:hypothetical protein
LRMGGGKGIQAAKGLGASKQTDVKFFLSK